MTDHSYLAEFEPGHRGHLFSFAYADTMMWYQKSSSVHSKEKKKKNHSTHKPKTVFWKAFMCFKKKIHRVLKGTRKGSKLSVLKWIHVMRFSVTCTVICVFCSSETIAE